MQKLYIKLILGTCILFGNTYASAERTTKCRLWDLYEKTKDGKEKLVDPLKLPQTAIQVAYCALRSRLHILENEMKAVQERGECVPKTLRDHLKFYADLYREVRTYKRCIPPGNALTTIGDIIYQRIFDPRVAHDTAELSFLILQAVRCYHAAENQGSWEADLKHAHICETYWDLIGLSEELCIKAAYSLLRAVKKNPETPSDIEDTLKARKASLRKRYPHITLKKKRRRRK